MKKHAEHDDDDVYYSKGRRPREERRIKPVFPGKLCKLAKWSPSKMRFSHFPHPVKKVIFLPFLSGGSTVLLIEGLPKSHTFAGVWRKAVLFGMSTVLTSVLFTRGPKHDFLNWSVMRRRLRWVGQAYTGGTLRACRWLACFFE